MSNMLNLDEVAKPAEKTLTIGGKAYPVLPMTVENFIETTKKAQELTATKADAREQLEATVGMIKRYVPTLPDEVLAKLSMEQLGVVVAFVQGDYQPDEKAAQAAQEAAGTTGKPTP